jgi:hypothetical protein
MNITLTLASMLRGGIARIRAVNRRYAKPRLAMSPAVKISLLCLRIYLLLLVGLLGYKFITLVMP